VSSLTLKNPHSVLAVLETRPHDILELHIESKNSTEAWGKVKHEASRQGIRVTEGAKKAAKIPVEGRVGSAFATVRERSPISIEKLFESVKEKGLWLALDCLQDPHNVGAIFRTAAFFGVQGILVTQERSASLTDTVYDVASGGLEFVPFSVVTNLQQAFRIAKESGLWILGASEHGHDDFRSVELDRSWLLVLGNEERGMRRLTEESCDVLCSVKPNGKVTSLNVSVAGGILMSALVKDNTQH
jgi:23S rRNA (guanosine2251-2'-O)-methyltransferase